MTKRAFTLIELLVVIAIIAILAAILFPVFAQAKLAAKKSAGLAQMKQLGTSVFVYAGDADDFMPMASARPAVGVAGDPLIWTQQVYPYVKSEQIFTVPGGNGKYAKDWANRYYQNIGYSDATGVQEGATTVEGAAPQGTESFGAAVNFSRADESARVGLFTTTPNSPIGTPGKERGYVFNPYNGPVDTTLTDVAEQYKTGLPLIADVNLCTTKDGDGNDYTSRGAGALKPVYAVYGADGKNNGQTPVIFADSHAKAYSAKALKRFGAVIWRFR